MKSSWKTTRGDTTYYFEQSGDRFSYGGPTCTSLWILSKTEGEEHMSRFPDMHVRLNATCAEVEDAFFEMLCDVRDDDFDY
ncbi:hypothetical protein [Rhodoferax sp. U11-2br]|uniref:hypothetical protein n=1 Tax=Rhodoferax sp. U11-2br TaxID=2838878 RepID=UPI001BEB9600|nr:hypothetical protein [Rhodoferax sp. U11-2br]MBT3067333.1 hypothetical protein [Rhodoferax sp. U11-2br]